MKEQHEILGNKKGYPFGIAFNFMNILKELLHKEHGH